MHRLDSMFGIQNLRVFNGTSFVVLDSSFRPVREETLEQALQAFLTYAEKTKIFEYDVSIDRPLRLTDCWGDDPIGSGALEIFKGNSSLSEKQRDELKNVFAPFSGVIYPDDVARLLSAEHLKEIQKQGRTNVIYQQEMEKRRGRSRSIGEDFAEAAAQESVWVHLTLKLREWAVANKYDAFVYENLSEGDGDDSYVTLFGDRQIKGVKAQWVFDRELFERTVFPVFLDYLNVRLKQKKETAGKQNIKPDNLYFVGRDPGMFWRREEGRTVRM